MFKSFLHHGASSAEECGKVCCTRIKNFGVKVGELTIFEDVNMHVHCGQLTAIIGPNGAGKSTLLKAILGEVEHTGELNYVDVKNQHTGNPIIGYVPQYLTFDVTAPVTVIDLFMACLSNKPVWLFSSKDIREQVAKNLSRVHAEHLIDRRLGALSGGELQRILLALALDPIPDLLLLDEPVSGVDQNGLDLFYEIVVDLKASEDMAIILISHDLEQVSKYADQVVLLDKKVLVVGPPEEVFANSSMKKIFGTII